MAPIRDKEQQEILEKAFFSYIGYQNVQNILKDLDDNKEEIQSIEIPKSLDETVYKFIKEIENNKRKSKFRDIYNKILRTRVHRAAAMLIMLVISMTILTVSVEAFRVRVFNMIMEQREKYLEIRLGEESPMEGINEIKQEGHYIPSYIPDGFKLEYMGGLDGTVTMIYTNQNDKKIIFDQEQNAASYQLDSENATKNDITINGFDGIYLLKEDTITIFWNDGELSFLLMAEIEFEELIKMAESITKNK